MAHCPECFKRVPFKTIFFALYPVWVTCSYCKTKLVADKFVVMEGFVLIAVTVLVCVALHLTGFPEIVKILLALPLVVVIAAVGTYITQLKGTYRRRGNKANRLPRGF